MIKKRILISSLVFLFLLPLQALGAANVISQTGSVIAGAPYFDSSNNRYTIDFVGTSVSKIVLQSWTDGYGLMQEEKSFVAQDYGYTHMVGMNFTCNTSYKTFLYNNSNTLLGTMDVVISGLVNPSCQSNGDGWGEPPPQEPVCDTCELFACPGWSDYMGKLDDIQAAIPPPPDWNNVAGIFRDTIAPRIKSDMAELIGTTSQPSLPSLPSAPTFPTAPPQPDGLTGGSISAPTGSLPSGFNDSGFSSGDIKQGAPVIQENGDDSGGFIINNPSLGLPSQQDFIDNAVEEAPFPFPTPPVGEETVEEGQDPVEPVISFPDIDYDNAPESEGGDFSEPVISFPDIDYTTPPSPNNSGDTGGVVTPAPTPVQGSEQAPIPGDPSNYNPPIP